MKNKLQTIAIVCVVLIALFLLNSLNSAKSPMDKAREAISQHRAVIILVKSGTERDREFLNLLKEIKPRLKGMGSIVIADSNSGFLESGEETPAIVIFDAHGNQLQRFSRTVDRRLLDETVHAIASHHH